MSYDRESKERLLLYIYINLYYITLLGPSYISTFNCGFICEHLLLYSIKKGCGSHYIFLAHFQNFTKIKNFLKFLSFRNLPWGPARCHTKFEHNRFSRFDVVWIQTERQAKYIDRLHYIANSYR